VEGLCCCRQVSKSEKEGVGGRGGFRGEEGGGEEVGEGGGEEVGEGGGGEEKGGVWGRRENAREERERWGKCGGGKGGYIYF
jgi:hypothetical protein